MAADTAGGSTRRDIGICVVVGLVGGFAAAFVVPEAVFTFRTAIVGAVCVGITGGLLSNLGLRETVRFVAVAEAIRSLALLLVSGSWVLLFGTQGSGFVVFYLLVGGGVALVVALVSVPLAAIVGGLTVTARATLQ